MVTRPNAEKAAVAFINELSPIAAATTLPSDIAQWTSPAGGRARFFHTVALVGGSSSMYLPVRNPVLQVTTWGRWPERAATAPIPATMAVAEDVYALFEDASNFPYRATWSGYLPAYLHSGFPLTLPRNIPQPTSDVSEYAQVAFDVSVFWTVGS